MLTNKTILLTGGGSGIGEAFALHLAENNEVVICGRNESRLKAVASNHNNISYKVADISDPEAIESLFIWAKSQGFVFDVLINNAGVVELWDLTRNKLSATEIFEKVNTNLSGAIAVTQQFITQADRNVDNIIINNTSEIVLLPVALMPLYSASKAGLSVFTKSLRVQLKKSKFRIVELLTPGVDTNMPKQLGNKGKLINPQTFVKEVMKSVSQGKTEYSRGPYAFLFKAFQRLSPTYGINLADKLSRKQLNIDSW
jgi:uncharacterized oxidoreductase